MRTVHFRPFVLAAGAALMLVTLANIATAQTPSPILNTLEVQKLVASTDPADNARLSAHFAALADRYAREATRHDAMAQAFIASPTRRTPTNSAATAPRANPLVSSSTSPIAVTKMTGTSRVLGSALRRRQTS